jgi:hypothetical protein
VTGDFAPLTDQPGWQDAASEVGTSCARG